MSGMIDFDDLYEDFLALTSSPSSSVFSPTPEQISASLPPGYSAFPEEARMNKEIENLNQNPVLWSSSYTTTDYWEHQTHYNEELVVTSELKPNPYHFPGGIEVALKEVPAECRTLLEPSDIPRAATARGYLTVSELLVIKRILLARYRGDCEGKPRMSWAESDGKRSNPRRGVKRSRPQESEKVSVIKCTSSVGRVGGAVKEAMKVLEDDHNNATYSASVNQSI